jgi:hypothetical protein
LLANEAVPVADEEPIAAAGFTAKAARGGLGRHRRAVAFELHVHALIVGLGLAA